MCIVKRDVMVTIFPAGSIIQENPDTQTGKIGNSKISGIWMIGLKIHYSNSWRRIKYLEGGFIEF